MKNVYVEALRTLSTVAASFAILVAVLVWVGYFFRIEELKSLINGATAMNPVTALCFMFVGLSAVFFHAKRERLRSAGLALSVLVAGIGLVKFLSYLWGLSVHFDQIFFASQIDVVVLGYRNEIAPNTALNFFFSGLALSWLYRKKDERLPQTLATITFFVAMLTILGYMYGAPDLTQFNSKIPMALNTALCFVALSLAIIFARPDRGYPAILVGSDAGSVVARRMLPLTIVIPVILGYVSVFVHQEGWMSVELSSALRVLVMCLLFFYMTWRLASFLQMADQAREAATDRLHEEKVRDEVMLASIGDGLVAIDKDWKITLWNPAASLITGWQKDEAVGKPFREIIRFIKESDRSEYVSFISEAMLSGKTKTMENHVLLIRKDNMEIPVGDSAAPIKDDKGQSIGAIIVFRDATAEKKRFMVSSDVAYASHQLRTPLTEAMWSLELAATQKKQAEVKESIAIATNSLRSVQKMTNSLLDVSEIDGGVVIPRYENVNVKKIVSDVVSDLRDKSRAKKITVTVSKANPALSVRTDAKLLTRALYEVAENAVLYSPEKSNVRIKVSEVSEGVLFQIEDEGVGVSDEQKPLVFTKFFRGRNVGEHNAGAGLGLFIAKQYVQLLKGKLWFTSKENEGSVFSLMVPTK